MTTDIDWGRLFFGEPKTASAASLRSGKAVSASANGYVEVLLDGSDNPVTIECDIAIEAGQVVSVMAEDDVCEVMGGGGSNAPDSIEEADPTVPAWAKQPNPPTYTAEDVGAAPAEHTHSQYLTEMPSHSHSQYALKTEVPSITYGTSDLTAGTSALATGAMYLVYE